MKVGIYTNLKKTQALEVTKNLIACFNLHSVDYYLYKSFEGKIEGKYFSFENFDFDIMFALGGDGTILKLAKHCANKNIPIFGINIGTVGFLTEIEPEQINELVPKVLSGEFSKEHRSMITYNDGENEYTALNDIVLNREYNSKLMLLDLYINGEIVDRYYCDGFIVSTPTGSTAYSLSAGGAILSPHAQALALTPINSHSLHSRPIVVDDNEKITLKVLKKEPFNLIADGDVVMDKYVGEVTIEKSKKSATFIRLDHHNSYNKLLKKLNKWSVADIEEKH
jgi:NAD+ kinase